MSRTITLIPGDGIGPEVTEATCRILQAAGVSIEWDEHVAGTEAFKRTGQALPTEVIDSIRRNGVALKGPVTTPIAEGFTSVNVALRKELDLYANLRPVRNLPSVPSRFTGVDLVIVRENTEDLYAGLEHEVVPGVVESLKIITERASTRIAEFAFNHARRHGRRQVTAVHKANIMKLGDGLFLESVRAVARANPTIPYTEKIVDAACLQLVLDPSKFDVLVMPNLYGDIVSDSVRRPGRRSRRGRVRQHWQGHRGVRSRPRERPRHCGQESREPSGAVALGDSDAPIPGRKPRRRPNCGRHRACADGGSFAHSRSRGHGVHV